MVHILDMDPKEARRILFQIGWGRDDTFFMSLNLTPEQADVFGDVIRRSDCKTSVEGSITKALRYWVKDHKERNRATRK